MKVAPELVSESSADWVRTVMGDFDAFLCDHANCERKASSMAMSFVAKYPDRVEIIPGLIETALEELEHFRDVYAVMEARGISLTQEMGEDAYVAAMIKLARTGRNERFLDRLLMASVIECRGAERFRLIYEALETGDLKKFYHRLWASEAKHGNVFIHMAANYFSEKEIRERLDFLVHAEAEILKSLPLKAALH